MRVVCAECAALIDDDGEPTSSNQVQLEDCETCAFERRFAHEITVEEAMRSAELLDSPAFRNS